MQERRAPMESERIFDAAVIGAGPAGMMCALAAARRGLSVAVADAHSAPGAKLSLAGGGMGNFTNRILDERFYVGSAAAFAGGLCRDFGCERVLELLAQLGLPFEERDLGRIFGLRPAHVFASRLAALCRDAGVRFFLGGTAAGFRRCLPGDGAPEGFSFRIGGRSLRARQLVLATGSPACPQCGASGRLLRLASAWGCETVPFRPVLTPFAMPSGWALDGLSGISLNVRLALVRAGRPYSPDPVGIRPLLFTHRGLSGPAALAASCWWQEGDALSIDFLPELDLQELLDAPDSGRLLVKNLLMRRLPARLAERLCPAGIWERKCAETGRKARQALADAVHRFTACPEGVEGFSSAEAAAGGVLLSSLTPHLESRSVPGLFFCGEVVDAAGLIGGYNIHWALASGHLAGRSLRRR
ncbi:MAG: aminoacetone oxidase family FAD-binding enzyme [Mailhella sp.]|nr:aminoacetone oxidase family FAD-binding enzyme [Mailhella sp.]